MNNAEISLPEACALLREVHSVVIFTHVKPDGDAIGSALGLGEYLNHNGVAVTAVLPEPMPEKYRDLTDGLYAVSTSAETLECADLVILLDCARSDRAATGGVDIGDLKCPLLVIDHHVDNDVAGDYRLVINAAATAAIIAELAQLAEDWELPAAAATLLYLGLTTDTGCFRFSNTTGAALETGSYLLSAGADSTRVINDAFFSKRVNQQLFEADLVLNHVFSEFDGQLRCGVITPELLDKYGFDMKDGESVIELLREIDTVLIAVLIYPRNGAWRLSLRSKDSRYPVGPLARELGGGGHDMAAGASLSGSAEEVCALLTARVGELLQK